MDDATLDHHLAVYARVACFHHKFTRFQGYVVCSLDHHGFDTPHIPAAMSRVHIQTNHRPNIPLRSRPLSPTAARTGWNRSQVRHTAHTQHHHLLIRRRAPPARSVSQLIQLVSNSPTFTRHRPFSRSTSVTVPVRIRLVIRRMISVSGAFMRLICPR